MKNFKIVRDESDDDFVKKDKLKSDKNSSIALDSAISNDRSNIDSLAPLTHIALKSLMYQQHCSQFLIVRIGLLFHWWPAAECIKRLH